MLEFNPRRQVHQVGDELVSFAILTRPFTWPPAIAQKLRAAQAQDSPLDPAVEEMLKAHMILRQRDPDDQIFRLKETREQGWTNSTRGQRILERYSHPLTVLDALSLKDIDRLPKTGAFLYMGDGHGGFHAETTGTPDTPCGRCLVIRYLAGRKASPKLYLALGDGATVAFAQPEQEAEALGQPGITLFGSTKESVSSVLPLPDCAHCIDHSVARPLEVGIFSPVISAISLPPNHGAHLPQMVWLADVDTIGSGGAYDSDPERGRARAINEALERYAAHFTPPTLTEQGIPFESSHGKKLMPSKRTLLTEAGSVSTGLACRESLAYATDDGLREVCESDALARLWLTLDASAEHQVGEIFTPPHPDLDLKLYQIPSYHQPTYLCVGRTPEGNIATGSACGPPDLAQRKARFECLQNAAYLRTYSAHNPVEPPRTSVDHASIYWQQKQEFPQLKSTSPPQPQPLPAPVYRCELTPPDLALTGRHVVRIQVPGLLHLPMSHTEWEEMLEESGSSASPPAKPHPFF